MNKLFGKATLKVIGIIAVAAVGTLIGAKALKKPEEPVMIDIPKVESEDEEIESI